MSEHQIMLLWRFFWGVILVVGCVELFRFLIFYSNYDENLNRQEGIIKKYKPFISFIDYFLIILISVEILFAFYLGLMSNLSIKYCIFVFLASFVVAAIRRINNNWRCFCNQ